jgi:ribonucleoside-diphosphate reductase alpha chain
LELHMTVAFYPDGRPGEVFLHGAKVGSTVRGLLDTVAVLISHALQHGMPAEAVAEALDKFDYVPDGPTGDPDVPDVRSVTTYIAQRLLLAVRAPGLIRG